MSNSAQTNSGPGNKIMVVVAHPDDAEFMCAGSMAKWTKEGAEGVYVIVTNGNKGTTDININPVELAKRRREEQKAACNILGVNTIEFLDFEDGMLENNLELRRMIVRLIRKHKPSAVITENPAARWVGNYINHPDHRAVGDATMDAVFPSARDVHMYPDLRLNEGLAPHIVEHLYLGMHGSDANFFVDISTTIDIKIRSLKAHESQVKSPNLEFDQFIRNMAVASAGETEHGMAESFRHFYLGEDVSEGNSVRDV